VADQFDFAEGSDYVRCPKCTSRHRDLYEYGLEDGQTGEVECDCGHTFEITCRVSVTYTVEEARRDR
jgi:DNA-directed RNA polymerase subunit RPC12/RpoP